MTKRIQSLGDGLLTWDKPGNVIMLENASKKNQEKKEERKEEKREKRKEWSGEFTHCLPFWYIVNT